MNSVWFLPTYLKEYVLPASVPLNKKLDFDKKLFHIVDLYYLILLEKILPLATITIKNVKIAETQGVTKSLTSKVSKSVHILLPVNTKT